MAIPKVACLVALVPCLAFAPALPAISSPSQGICTSIREEYCVVDAREQAISIVKKDLRGKKHAKSVARLIGRPICNRIVNKFAFSPVGHMLNGWQMKLRDGRRKPLYSCRL
jgi:hypothetical protein